VIIAVKAFQSRLMAMTPPRVVFTPHPMGRPLGAPFDKGRHRETIHAALYLLENATEAGTQVTLPGYYHTKE